MKTVNNSEWFNSTTVNIDGTRLIIIDEPILTDISGIAIARAKAIDSNCDEYYLYWEIINEDAENLEDCCEWDSINYIELI